VTFLVEVIVLTQFLKFAFERRGWLDTRFTQDGRRIRKDRVEWRSSRYYDGDAPSQSYWAVLLSRPMRARSTRWMPRRKAVFG
jgi:hypothetical protein